MDSLDVTTLLVVNFTNIAVTAVALPFIMGRGLSPAAHHARAAVFLQGLGCILLVVAGVVQGYWLARALASVSIAALSLGQWQMYCALQGWLGRRPMRALMVTVCVLAPVGYLLSYDSYTLRTGLTNALVSVQSLVLAWCCLFPKSALDGRWRWVFCGCGVALAIANGARAVLGAFYTELLPSLVTPHPANVVALVVVNVAMVLVTVCVLVAWRSEAEAQLRKIAMTDTLSNLLNRRGWVDYSDRAWANHLRQQTRLSVLVLDLDHFKRINDTAGHSVGDQVISAFAESLRATVRAGDIVARMGGEEFAVLMHDADEAAARALDQRLRLHLQANAIPGWSGPVSFSAGLAISSVNDASIEAMLGRADSALYQAKHLGRGRLEMASPAVTIDGLLQS